MAQWWLNTPNMRTAGWSLISYGSQIQSAGAVRAATLSGLSGPLIDLLATDLDAVRRRSRIAGTACASVGRRLGQDAEAEDRQREFEKMISFGGDGH